MWQRVVRNPMVNKRGREQFSALVSFNYTCQLNGVWPCRTARDLCLNPSWNMFSGVPDRGPYWSLFDRRVPVRAMASARPSQGDARRRLTGSPVRMHVLTHDHARWQAGDLILCRLITAEINRRCRRDEACQKARFCAKQFQTYGRGRRNWAWPHLTEY